MKKPSVRLLSLVLLVTVVGAASRNTRRSDHFSRPDEGGPTRRFRRTSASNRFSLKAPLDDEKLVFDVKLDYVDSTLGHPRLLETEILCAANLTLTPDQPPLAIVLPQEGVMIQGCHIMLWPTTGSTLSVDCPWFNIKGCSDEYVYYFSEPNQPAWFCGGKKLTRADDLDRLYLFYNKREKGGYPHVSIFCQVSAHWGPSLEPRGPGAESGKGGDSVTSTDSHILDDVAALDSEDLDDVASMRTQDLDDVASMDSEDLDDVASDSHSKFLGPAEVSARPLVKALHGQLCPTTCGFFAVPSSNITAPPSPETEPGTEIDGYKYPFVVEVTVTRDGDKVAFGGTLLNSNTVLTTARHFGPNTTMPAIRVVAGRHFKAGATYAYEVGIVSMQVHPEYDFTAATSYADLALLELDPRLDISRYVTTACLAPPTSTYDRARVIMAGWGQLMGRSSNPSTHYRESTGTVLDTRKCASVYEQLTGRPLTTKRLCVAMSSGDSCLGDTGGPVIVKGHSRWFFIGVLSENNICSNSSLPSVALSVPAHHDWILRTAFKGKCE